MTSSSTAELRGPAERVAAGAARFGRVALAAVAVVSIVVTSRWLPIPGELVVGGFNILPWALPVLFTCTIAEGIYLSFSAKGYNWKTWLASSTDEMVRPFFNLLPLSLVGPAMSLAWEHRICTVPIGPVWSFFLILLGEELCFYIQHWAQHRVRLLWATHAVHHSSNDYTLVASFRDGWTYNFTQASMVFVPLVWLGFRPDVLTSVILVALVYQFWLHTELVPRLGWFEWVMNTPGHHRVHHSSDTPYLDKNYGQVVIIFDRIFGTFAREKPGEVLHYGKTVPVQSYNPVYISFHEWIAMVRDVRRAKTWRERFFYVFGPPGWKPAAPPAR